MSFVSQTTSAATPATLIGDIHLSKAILEGLHSEIHNPDPSHHKSPLEAIGLLFGTVDADSLWLEHFEPVPARAGDFLAAGERLERILGDRISAVRQDSVQGSALLGWYISRSDNHPGLLDRDVAIHNAFFHNHHDVAIIWKREARGHFAIELYAAKPGILLSKNNHRVASWRSARLTVLPEDVHVMPVDSGNDELFLNVYKAAKSLDQADPLRNWGRIRQYTERLIPTFGKPAKLDEDEFFSPGLTISTSGEIPTASTLNNGAVPQGTGSILTRDTESGTVDFHPQPGPRTNADGHSKAPDRASSTHAASTPQEPSNFLEQGESAPLPMWLPPSLAATSLPRKKNQGFLSTAAWLLGTIIVSVLTYIGAHLYLKPMLLNLTGQTTAGAVAVPKAGSVPPVMGLKVGQNGSALDLYWNPLYPPIQRALSAKLVIKDGIATREIEMDRAQLNSGRIAYIPVSSDVQFSFRVTDSPSDTVADSIRVLITPSESASNGSRRAGSDRKPSSHGTRGRTIVVQPTVPAGSSAVSIGQPPTSTSPKPEQGNRAAGSAEAMSEPLIVHPVSPMPQFRSIPGLDAAAVPSAGPTRNVTNQPAHQVVSSGLTRQGLPIQDHQQSDLKMTPRLKIPDGITDRKSSLSSQLEIAHQQPSAASPPLPVERRSFTPPVVLHRQSPVLRPGVLTSNVVVPVIVRINEKGKIDSVALATADSNIRPEISKEALAAARKWRFSPGKLGDIAVSSEMRINFVFKHSADGTVP